VAAGLLGLGGPQDSTPEDLGALAAAEAFYAARPRVERPVAGWQEIPAGLTDLSAASCGECHRAIYEEWRVSTHAFAWTDRQFQAEREKSGNRWLCNNCHTPLMNQMESWAVGLEAGDVDRPRYVENPAFEPALRSEGISCAGCHVRDGVVEGPTGRATEAHATRRAERFSGSEICLACHQAVQHYEGKDFVCVFETGEEWAEGPYGPGGSAQSCLACHMPPVTRPLAEGAPPRVGRHHDWPGAGIYKVEGVGPPLDRLGPGLSVEVEAGSDHLRIDYANAAAGHRLPTGDPERFIRIEVEFLDGADRRVGAWSERIGQQWKWWPEAEKLADNRLAPLEARQATVPRPPQAVAWKLTASSHRISQEALDYHDLEGYPASRVTHRLEGRFEP
jgi:hypothetical protein